jgi:hypothetical protein
MNTTENVGMTNREIDAVTKRTMKDLKGQKKVKITIPSLIENDRVEGSINGHTFMFPTNVEVEMPLGIYEIIKNSREVIVKSAAELMEYVKGAGKNLTPPSPPVEDSENNGWLLPNVNTEDTDESTGDSGDV